METLHCECGSTSFNVQGGVKRAWWEHVLICRACGKQYNLPILHVNGRLYNGLEPGSVKTIDPDPYPQEG